MYEWGLQERFNVRALCPKLMQCHGGRLWALELQGGGGGGGFVLSAAYRERKGCCSKILGSSLAYKCKNWLHIWKLNQPRCRIKPLSCLLLPSVSSQRRRRRQRRRQQWRVPVWLSSFFGEFRYANTSSFSCHNVTFTNFTMFDFFLLFGNNVFCVSSFVSSGVAG